MMLKNDDRSEGGDEIYLISSGLCSSVVSRAC